MIEWLGPALGFVSASLVALIALGFGFMFVFFAGSASLVLGEFLVFSRPPRVAMVAVALASATMAILAALSDVAYESGWLRWSLPAMQLICATVAYALVRAERLHRPLRWGTGAWLLGSGGLYLVSLFVPDLAAWAVGGLAYVAFFLGAAVLGLWPLVIAGLIEHRRQRPVEWFIALRYLFAKRRQTFISVITVICVTGVALGVAVITVVLSVMNGFSQVWEGKIIGTRAHFVVHSHAGPYAGYEAIRQLVLAVPGVEGATPFVAADAIMRGEGGSLQAVILKGIDPSTVAEATQLVADMVQGSLAELRPDLLAEGSARLPGVILGAELADRFFLQVGDPLVLISPLGGPPTPLGPAPRMVRFRVAGVFRAGFFEFDESFVYTSLQAAQHFTKLDDVVSGIEVRTEDPYRSQAVGRRVEVALGGLFYARDWKSFYPGFFQALKMERAMMFVLLSFIMVVAGFIIIATLITMIMEKSRDIAILKAMGCDDDGVLRMFAIQGFLIGTAGLSLGLAMGLVITSNLHHIQSAVERMVGFDVLPANVYQLQHLPYDVVPGQLGAIALIAMVLSVGATRLPSWQAARLDPAEALRYE